MLNSATARLLHCQVHLIMVNVKIIAHFKIKINAYSEMMSKQKHIQAPCSKIQNFNEMDIQMSCHIKTPILNEMHILM